MYTLGVVLLIAAVASIWIGRRDSQSADSRNALFSAQKTLDEETMRIAEREAAAAPASAPKTVAGKTVPAEKPKADPASIEFKRLDVDKEFPESVKKLAAVGKAYGGTSAGFAALMSLGDLYYRHGEVTKAVPHYEQALRAGSTDLDRALAALSLGYAYENQGKSADAIQAFEKSLGYGQAGVKGDALLGIARSAELKGDAAKARATYDQILTQLPNTNYAKTAENQKALLR